MLAIPFTEHFLHLNEQWWLLVSGRDPATDQHQVVQVGRFRKKLHVFATAEGADRHVDQFLHWWGDWGFWTVCGTPLIVDTGTFCPYEAGGIQSWAAQMHGLLSQIHFYPAEGSRCR